MLYDILMVLLTVYIMVLPFLLFYMTAVLLGRKDSVPKPRKRHAKAGLSEKDQRIIDILANVDAYDGTSSGQKPIGD